jgi:hypothetical protein
MNHHPANMPMIHIEYDDTKLKKDEILKVSNAIQKIVSEKTHIEDVFVYANSAQIKVKIAPIEIFVRMSEHKVKNLDTLFNQVKSDLIKWKKKARFNHPINLTIIPMKWKFETGI